MWQVHSYLWVTSSLCLVAQELNQDSESEILSFSCLNCLLLHPHRMRNFSSLSPHKSNDDSSLKTSSLILNLLCVFVPEFSTGQVCPAVGSLVGQQRWKREKQYFDFGYRSSSSEGSCSCFGSRAEIFAAFYLRFLTKGITSLVLQRSCTSRQLP